MPPKFPFVDESKFIKTLVEFRSGTPSMTMWSTQLTITAEAVILESEIDGKVQPGNEFRRSKISKLTVDFEASPDHE
ncbi:MAG: hypothetical protein ACT452_04355 [Microthrixaceae bacterium]